MALLNVSFGIFALMPQGWMFMLSVIMIEAVIMSKRLAGKIFDTPTFVAAFISNFVSGVVGIVASIMLNGGWWLVVWFPWVSSHEVDGRNIGGMSLLAAYYLVALIVSLLIEGLLNILLLRHLYGKKEIVKATLVANAVTYAIGAILICLFVYL